MSTTPSHSVIKL